eukprot:9477765-Pyramimonas_sp.AAC.2
MPLMFLLPVLLPHLQLSGYMFRQIHLPSARPRRPRRLTPPHPHIFPPPPLPLLPPPVPSKDIGCTPSLLHVMYTPTRP